MKNHAIKPANHSGLAIRVLALAAVAGIASTALAQGREQGPQTPKGWNYEIRDGRRIPKINRVTNPAGSWREEIRQGSCITVRERAATGEYKETRQCNPVKPG